MSSLKVDKAFELIQKGKELEKSGNHWGAADSFSRASTLLSELAEDTFTENKDPETDMISKLYHTKSTEYRQQARECFIHALKYETDRDMERDSPLAELLTEEEAATRVATFTNLFSKQIEVDNVHDISSKTSKLEERLMELNASLPSGFKTDAERLKDINRGLGRLGLSLYPNSDHKSMTIEVEQSEEEQVAQILAQAEDEAHYGNEKAAQKAGASGAATSDRIDSSDSEDDDDDDDDESIDLEDVDSDAAVLKNKKAIRRYVVKAQVKLAETMACTDLNNEAENSEAVDVDIVQQSLLKAKKYVDKALKEFAENM